MATKGADTTSEGEGAVTQTQMAVVEVDPPPSAAQEQQQPVADTDPMEQYYLESARQCSCNDSCECCTCRCCAFFILLCWIIFGFYAAITSLQMLNMAQDWYVSPDCEAATTYQSTTEHSQQMHIPDGDCCVATTTVFGQTITEYHEPGFCDSVKPAYSVSIALGFS